MRATWEPRLVVVGLETLRSYDALAGICREAGVGTVALSLDLRNGRPVCAFPNDDPPEVVAARAADAGADAVIVIDLARVGMNAGLDLELIGRLRAAVPAVTLVAGGGIRGPDDLSRLADAGCDGALVATALLEGRLSAADVAGGAVASAERDAIDGRLAEVLFDFHLDRRDALARRRSRARRAGDRSASPRAFRRSCWESGAARSRVSETRTAACRRPPPSPPRPPRRPAPGCS